MNLITIGINHNTAPIELREQVSMNEANTISILESIKTTHASNEAVLISTCNRTELYSTNIEPEAAFAWLAKTHQLDPSLLTTHSYVHRDQAAIEHLMRVACGLDSMVLGEPQIFGQVKSAVQLAKKHGLIGKRFNQLMQTVFNVSKHVRTQTDISRCPMSIAYCASLQAKQLFGPLTEKQLANKHALLIGAGDTIELCAFHLKKLGIRKFTIANRTLEKAQQLSQTIQHPTQAKSKPVAEIQAKAIQIAEIPITLPVIDIVCSATASQLPLLGKGLLERIMLQRDKQHPLMLFDLAVPRDIEPEVTEIDHVSLYNIDDLRAIVQKTQQHRSGAAKQAEGMIAAEATQYMMQLRTLDAVDTIKAYRQQVRQLANHCLNKAQCSLKKGTDPAHIIQHLSTQLSNKILHAPTLALKEAAKIGDAQLLQNAKQLLGLDAHDT